MLFKILHGDPSSISLDITPFHEGWCYVTHDGYFYVDLNTGTEEIPNNQRLKLNANNAQMLCGMTLEELKAEFQAQPDWKQNDIEAEDYIKNRPFYDEEVDKEYVVSEADWFEVLTSGQEGIITKNPLEVGKEYTITMNGISKKYIAQETFSDDDGVMRQAIYLGDDPNSQENFVHGSSYFDVPDFGLTGMRLTDPEIVLRDWGVDVSTITSMVVKVTGTRKETVPHPMSGKYIEDGYWSESYIDDQVYVDNANFSYKVNTPEGITADECPTFNGDFGTSGRRIVKFGDNTYEASIIDYSGIYAGVPLSVRVLGNPIGMGLIGLVIGSLGFSEEDIQDNGLPFTLVTVSSVNNSIALTYVNNQSLDGMPGDEGESAHLEHNQHCLDLLAANNPITIIGADNIETIHRIPEKYIPDSAKGLSPEEKVQFTEALAKLETIAEGAEVNVQADWNATEGDAQILNKPELADVATSGSYEDLVDKPELSDEIVWGTATKDFKAGEVCKVIANSNNWALDNNSEFSNIQFSTNSFLKPDNTILSIMNYYYIIKDNKPSEKYNLPKQNTSLIYAWHPTEPICVLRSYIDSIDFIDIYSYDESTNTFTLLQELGSLPFGDAFFNSNGQYLFYISGTTESGISILKYKYNEKDGIYILEEDLFPSLLILYPEIEIYDRLSPSRTTFNSYSSILTLLMYTNGTVATESYTQVLFKILDSGSLELIQLIKNIDDPLYDVITPNHSCSKISPDGNYLFLFNYAYFSLYTKTDGLFYFTKGFYPAWYSEEYDNSTKISSYIHQLTFSPNGKYFCIFYQTKEENQAYTYISFYLYNNGDIKELKQIKLTDMLSTFTSYFIDNDTIICSGYKTYTFQLCNYDVISSLIDNDYEEFYLGQVISNALQGEAAQVKLLSKENKTAHHVEPVTSLTLIDRITGLHYTLAIENGSLITYRAINGISVATPPAKTLYKVDETFDPTGMIVVVNYSDGEVQEIEDYTVAAPAPTSAGTYSVEVSYTTIETYKTSVEVEYIEPSGIEITTPPTKTAYTSEDTELDLTGMIVTLKWDDGTTETITDYTVSTPDFTSADEIEVIVTYGEYTDSFMITVTRHAVYTDFEATYNGDGTYTITAWKGTYNGEPSTELIIPDDPSIIL